jgi:hypothetical protein
MGNPIFRFTLRHEQVGNLEITELDGWMDCKLKLERHEEFHSLVEYFEGAFIFYGDNGVDNGGIDFIRYVEKNYGVDATLNIDIEVSFDSGRAYEFIFSGQLDLEAINELKDNRAQIPIIQSDFWAKFISRKGTPANLHATTDTDGESITPVQSIRIDLPSQKIRYVGNYQWLDTFTYYEADDGFGDGMTGLQMDWDISIQDDLKKFTLPRSRFQIGSISGVVADGSLIGNFEAPYDGEYTFDIKIYAAYYIEGLDLWDDNLTQIDFYLLKTTETALSPVANFSESTLSCGSDAIGVFTFSKTLTLFRGEQVVIFGIDTSTQQRITIFGSQRLEYQNVLVASTGALVLSGEQTVDGVATNLSLVLVKDNPDPADNGVYTTSPGAWTRASFAATEADLVNLAVFVTSGDTNVNSNWKLSNTVDVINVSPQSWVFISDSDERLRAFPCPVDVDTHLIINGDTIFRRSRADAFLLHDAGAAILKSYGLGETNPFYSEYIGGLLTNARSYPENGCEWQYAILKGLNLRGYDLEDKPFFMSFEQWWKGANPILNLGLGYDTTATTPDQNLIRTERRSFFFTREISAYFDYVFEISREYDSEKIFNKIEIGYPTWQSEDVSGIDDPQTKHTYATRFKKVGKGIEVYSDFIAASLAIEATRRQTISQSKDYKFDNNVFILAVRDPGGSPDVFLPEVDENFSSITNLLNSDTRYNSRLTPARNFIRNRNYFNGALQSYLGSNYKFVNGEGNYDMISQMIANGCDYPEVLDEGQNINVTSDFLHLPLLYTIEINLAWDDYVAIREARHKAIGISQTASEHVMFFIKSLEYELVKGKATIKAWPIEFFDIVQTDFIPQMKVCESDSECGDGALDRTTSEDEGRTTSEGECRTIA